MFKTKVYKNDSAYGKEYCKTQGADFAKRMHNAPSVIVIPK